MKQDDLSEGKRLARLGRYEESLVYLERAVRGNESGPDCWLALAACYFKLDRNDDFREAVRQALLIDPNHRPTRRFLKRTTGSDEIPAPDPGRGKIYLEE